MSDWQVGDEAVCIDAEPQRGDFLRHQPGLAEGRLYTVSGVVLDSGPADRCLVGLTLFEISPVGGRIGFCADRFRKIVRDKREACEPEFVTLLKRSKRKVEA